MLIDDCIQSAWGCWLFICCFSSAFLNIVSILYSLQSHSAVALASHQLAFCFQSLKRLKKFKVDEARVSVCCMCVCVCLCVCMSCSSDFWEVVVEVIIIQLGTVTASDMRMHHMLIMLTATFIQSHTDDNHENNKCLILLTP